MIRAEFCFARITGERSVAGMALEMTRQESDEAAASLKRFLGEELDFAAGDLQTGQLLKFFWEEIAPLAYNRGVKDAESFFRQRVEDLGGVCFEQPMTFWSKKRRTR